MSNRLGSLTLLLSLTTFSSAQQSVSILIIQSTPGGAQVYVDDELRGTSSQRGKLKIAVEKTGKHLLRLSLLGYDDWEGDVSLRAGQVLTKEVRLVRTVPKQQRDVEGPTVEETLAFIKNLMDEYGRASHSFDTFDQMYVSSLDNAPSPCQLLINEHVSDVSRDGRSAPRSLSKTSVDLSTIDPASVQVEQEFFYPYAIVLHTTNNVKQIAVESTGYAANEGTTNAYTDGLAIPITAKEQGERLAKAFAYAAKLCGGKLSAF